MSSREEIMEQLHQVANATPPNLNLWKEDEDWVELINDNCPDSKIDVEKSNDALLRDPSTKGVIHILDGAINKIGICHNRKLLRWTMMDDDGREITKKRSKSFCHLSLKREPLCHGATALQAVRCILAAFTRRLHATVHLKARCHQRQPGSESDNLHHNKRKMWQWTDYLTVAKFPGQRHRRMPATVHCDGALCATLLFSPVSQGLSTLPPRKSKDAVEARQEQKGHHGH